MTTSRFSSRSRLSRYVLRVALTSSLDFDMLIEEQIMDRKMDSGVLNEGESLDEEYDVARTLLPEEILGIIDQLLCLEASISKQTKTHRSTS